MNPAFSKLSSLALERLQKAPGKVSTERAEKLEAHIRGQDFSAGDLRSLAHARLLPSTTLLKEIYSPGIELDRWNKTNEFILTALSSGRSLDGKLIREIHAGLCPDSNFRAKSVQGGNTEYPEGTDLETLWNIFENRIKDHQPSPIIKAAEVYQWLITLHFFEDANGRLARLCADYVLLTANLIPVSFANDAAAFVSALAEPVPYSVDDAISRICEGLEYSSLILLK